MPNLNENPGRRFIRRHGEQVTLKTYQLSHDETSDWDDETRTETTTTVQAVIARPRSSEANPPGEAGDRIPVDHIVYVRDDISQDVNDVNDDTPSIVSLYGADYTVLVAEDRPNGVTRLKVSNRGE